MQSSDREIQSLIFPGNKATDQNKFDNCEEYEHLNQKVLYLNNQASDHPACFYSPFHTLLGYSICFENCVTSSMTKFESLEQDPSKSLCS